MKTGMWDSVILQAKKKNRFGNCPSDIQHQLRCTLESSLTSSQPEPPAAPDQPIPLPQPKQLSTMASNGDNMEVETAELKLKEMAHSEQHYFNRYAKYCTVVICTATHHGRP